MSGPIGESTKIHFSSTEAGAPGENMWADKVGRDTYELKNNGFFFPVAMGDLVRVKVVWPLLEVIEVVERKRRTARILFDLPWPDRSGRAELGAALREMGYQVEWGQPNLLSVGVPMADDPYETISPLLSENARIYEVE
ncbi:DUF4265 domain-containing protein [Asanoa iriomotensis]|uniref:DUF4265 domain-containing protein n=1 Tax=Asanoa iriomotensis TaxID=234613 RepID=UPI001942FC14|nr:DUF4265 domain-containing protein [Asanoa iriomotensis]